MLDLLVIDLWASKSVSIGLYSFRWLGLRFYQEEHLEISKNYFRCIYLPLFIPQQRKWKYQINELASVSTSILKVFIYTMVYHWFIAFIAFCEMEDIKFKHTHTSNIFILIFRTKGKSHIIHNMCNLMLIFNLNFNLSTTVVLITNNRLAPSILSPMIPFFKVPRTNNL